MNPKAIAAAARDRLRARLAERRLSAGLVSHPVHVGYLSGYFPPPDRFAALWIAPDESFLLAPRASAPTADEELGVVTYEDHTIERLIDIAAEAAAALERLLSGAGYSPRRLGLEPAYLPAIYREVIARCLDSEVEDINPMLRALRAVKFPAEIAAIEQAVATCDRIFAAVERTARIGTTELEVYLTAVRVIAEDAAGFAVLDGDFVSGPRTEERGGPPSPRALEAGDPLIVDVYPQIAGYWADCTRTFVADPPRQALVDRHGILLEALEAGERALAPGLSARELYQTVRGALERVGLAQYFPHHAGHGVGLTPSEEPRLIPGSDERLQEGMVVALEPGVYIPGEGGMRLEDDLLITAAGCRRLSRYPRRLVAL